MTTGSDFYAMVVIQGLLFAFALFAMARAAWLRQPRGGATLTVRRGPESHRRLGLVYGFASVMTLQLINSSEAFTGHKVFLSFVDVLILFYLCFINGWFRNKVLGWISKWEAAPEL